MKEYDSLVYFGKELTDYANSAKNFLSMGKFAHLMAYYHEKVKQNIDSSFYYLNVSKNYFLKVPDSSRAFQRLLRIGVLQNIRNDFFGAKETLTEALLYPTSSQNLEYLASLYNELGSNNKKLLNYSDAVSYYQLAIHTSNSENDIIGYKNNLAMVYTESGEHNKAIILLKALLSDSLLKKSTSKYARILHNHTYAKWRNGEKHIETPFFNALNIRKAKNDKHGQISSYTDIGEYFSKNQPQKAKKYLDTVITLSKELKIPKAETDALKFLMQLEPQNVSFKDRYIFLKDSMYKNELKVKTQFAKMKYDDEQEKNKIVALETETATKKIELSEQRLQKVVFLSLSGFILLLGGFLFFILRQRHQREKRKEVYSTEKRISQKIHDELANDVYGLMANVQHTPKLETNQVLDSLEHIYKKTRDISHETGEIDTKNFNEELKRLLARYQNENTTITVKGLDSNLLEGISTYKKVALYRVLNELLVNMKKHSAASLVALLFLQKNKNIEICYTDNGKGFKPNQKYGAGLRNTENRIQNIGGTLTLDSEYGKGAKIMLTFPA